MLLYATMVSLQWCYIHSTLWLDVTADTYSIYAYIHSILQVTCNRQKCYSTMCCEYMYTSRQESQHAARPGHSVDTDHRRDLAVVSSFQSELTLPDVYHNTSWFLNWLPVQYHTFLINGCSATCLALQLHSLVTATWQCYMVLINLFHFIISSSN